MSVTCIMLTVIGKQLVSLFPLSLKFIYCKILLIIYIYICLYIYIIYIYIYIYIYKEVDVKNVSSK